MTCIVAVTKQGRSWVGGDSCIAEGEGGGIKWRTAAKIWRQGPFLIGAAGSATYDYLLRYRMKWPAIAPAPSEIRRYMLVDVPDHMREICTRGGVSVPDGAAIVAVAGTLWTYDDDECEQVAEDYAAVGSGSEVALGALHATARFSPKRRVMLALEASAAHRVDVAPPFHVITS